MNGQVPHPGPTARVLDNPQVPPYSSACRKGRLKFLYSEQVINFEPVLRGQLYGPLRDLKVFNQVRIDPEVSTIVWPNGADFDPATLYEWPTHGSQLIELAKNWELCRA